MHRARRLLAYNLDEPGIDRRHGPALPYARAMLGARAVHEWAHLAVDAGWVPLAVPAATFEHRLGALAAQLDAVVARAPEHRGAPRRTISQPSPVQRRRRVPRWRACCCGACPTSRPTCSAPAIWTRPSARPTYARTSAPCAASTPPRQLWRMLVRYAVRVPVSAFQRRRRSPHVLPAQHVVRRRLLRQRRPRRSDLRRAHRRGGIDLRLLRGRRDAVRALARARPRASPCILRFVISCAVGARLGAPVIASSAALVGEHGPPKGGPYTIVGSVVKIGRDARMAAVRTQITLVRRMADIDRAEWDALLGPDGSPFLEWDWLDALEQSGCVTREDRLGAAPPHGARGRPPDRGGADVSQGPQPGRVRLRSHLGRRRAARRHDATTRSCSSPCRSLPPPDSAF